MKKNEKDTLTARFDSEIRIKLFLNVNRRGSNPPAYLNQKIIIGKGGENERRIEVTGPSSLTRSHAFVFLALCKIASEKNIEKMSMDDPLFSAMRGEGQYAKGAKKICAKLSLREIAIKAGRSTGKALNDTLNYIRDLSKITITISWNDENGDLNEYSSALIGYYRKGGDISISFHFFLSLAIAGDFDYSSITWDEFEKLEDDNAKFLLVILSSRVKPGQKQRLRLDTILDDLYGDTQVSERANRERVKSVQDSLFLISETGWTVEKSGESSYFFTRPKVF